MYIVIDWNEKPRRMKDKTYEDDKRAIKKL